MTVAEITTDVIVVDLALVEIFADFVRPVQFAATVDFPLITSDLVTPALYANIRAGKSIRSVVRPDNATHSQTAGEPFVGTVFRLTPADTNHGQTADGSSVAFRLAIDDARHMQTAGDSAFVYNGVLVPDDASYAQSAESPTIIFVSLTAELFPVDTAHVQAADSSLLGVNYSVGPDDATHGQVADSSAIAFTDAAQLAPDDAAHSQVADSTTITDNPPGVLDYAIWDAFSVSFATTVIDEYQLRKTNDGSSYLKADIGQGSGVHYFEMHSVSVDGNTNQMVGLGGGAGGQTSYPGQQADGLAYWPSNGQIRKGGVTTNVPAIQTTAASVIGAVVDIDAQTISWFVDGTTGQQDFDFSSTVGPAGGIANLFPAAGNSGTSNQYEYRINSGQEPFSYPNSIPVGCHLGWGVDLPIKEAVGPDPLLQQIDYESISATASNGSLTYGVPTTPGNLLITAVGIDKSSGAITLPTGFTLVGTAEEGSSISGALAYKIADGTETTITWNWSSGRNFSIWLAEYSGVSALDVFAEANSNDSSVTSQTTGTTAANAIGNSLAVAIWGADTSNNAFRDQLYSNGFTPLHGFEDNVNAGLAVAVKVLSGTAPVECTFSTGDSGDQLFGKVGVFK